MAKFASPKKQSASVIKKMQGRDNVISSVGTARNYQSALTRVAEWVQGARIPVGLRGLTPEQALHYLEQRAQQVGQSALNMERQAIQAMFQHVTGHLSEGQTLRVVKSELEEALRSRAYTRDQVDLVSQAQQERNALSTELAYAAGLRAHELLTLRRADERAPDSRPTRSEKFLGRQGELYTVHGKGGLVRHVVIPKRLADQLEALRFDVARLVIDRGIHYQQSYNLAGGQPWSSSYSAASARVLGWSTGAHGLRHSYAQERMGELQRSGLSRPEALEIVSQELGHFRPQITEVYLR
ncbi:site-specific integrase [Pseudomonas sp. NFX98]|uniref:site-specific integrase n=1 Tax=Pseudomonas sp. NFX98 TaxID=3399122 RepID=UPI0039FDACA0